MEIFKLTVDNKINIWRRDIVVIEAESLEKAIELASDGDYNDILESSYLSETEEYLSPDDGFTTCEIIDEYGNTIWENGNR